jgi:hypothetical protein
MEGYNRKYYYIGNQVDLGYFQENLSHGKNIRYQNGKII